MRQIYTYNPYIYAHFIQYYRYIQLKYRRKINYTKTNELHDNGNDGTQRSSELLVFFYYFSFLQSHFQPFIYTIRYSCTYVLQEFFLEQLLSSSEPISNIFRTQNTSIKYCSYVLHWNTLQKHYTFTEFFSKMKICPFNTLYCFVASGA